MVRFAAYSPQDNTLASCGADRTVKLWNILDGRCLMTFKGHANWVMSVIAVATLVRMPSEGRAPSPLSGYQNGLAACESGS